MIDKLKTALLVSLVTVLIWTFAEAEGLRIETVQFSVVLQNDPGGPIAIRPQPGSDFNGAVTARVEGATANIDTLRDALRRPLVLKPGEDEVPATPGTHLLDLRAALRAHPEFRARGVSITDAQPAIVEVQIEEMVEHPLKVTARVPEGDLDGPATVSPDTVLVRLPKRLWESLGPDPEAVARIDPATLRSLPVGRRSTVRGLAIELPEPLRGADLVTVEPARVNVDLTLRSRMVDATLASVPVQIRIAPLEYGKWDLTIPEEDHFLRDVTISGPRGVIADLQSGELPVVAYVALSFEELERAALSGEPITKEAVFSDLPSELDFHAEERTVRVFVRPRQAPAGAAADGSAPRP